MGTKRAFVSGAPFLTRPHFSIRTSTRARQHPSAGGFARYPFFPHASWAPLPQQRRRCPTRADPGPANIVTLLQSAWPLGCTERRQQHDFNATSRGGLPCCGRSP
jgi:hypothetical protein